MNDVTSIKIALRDQTFIKVKAECDQFAAGMETLGVMDSVKKYPSLMKSLFCDTERPKLDKGINYCSYQVPIANYIYFAFRLLYKVTDTHV